HSANVLFEENILDEIGTNVILDHGLYLADGDRLTVRGNIFSRTANFGHLFGETHSNPTSENNLFVRNGNGLSIGGITADATVRNNVFLKPAGQGVGVFLGNSEGASLSGNIFAEGTKRNPAIRPHGGLKDVTIAGNVVYAWSDTL